VNYLSLGPPHFRDYQKTVVYYHAGYYVSDFFDANHIEKYEKDNSPLVITEEYCYKHWTWGFNKWKADEYRAPLRLPNEARVTSLTVVSRLESNQCSGFAIGRYNITTGEEEIIYPTFVDEDGDINEYLIVTTIDINGNLIIDNTKYYYCIISRQLHVGSYLNGTIVEYELSGL